MQQPPGWHQQRPGYGQQPGYQQRPPSYGPPPPPPVPPPRKRKTGRRIGIVLGVLLLLAGMVAGYLYLVYNRSVGLPPSADPMPAECELSAELLARVGAPSWQSGPLRDRGNGVRGVSCRWAAAEEENVHERMLTVDVDRFPTAKAAKVYRTERAKQLGTDEDLKDVADGASLYSSEGDAWVVARQHRTVFYVQLAGSAKGFFSGILGDDAETEMPAAQARELVLAVLEELTAK